MKVPLHMWSGGLDSTYLLWLRLKEGWTVDILYTDLRNNGDTNKWEILARKRLKKELLSLKGNIRTEIEYRVPVIHNASSVILPQIFLWVQTILFNFDSKKHSCIELGYVKGDDFWHHKDKVLEYLEIATSIHKPELKIKNIQYPLEWFTKASIINKLKSDPVGKKLLPLIRYCEETKREACGKCPSCIKHKLALYESKLIK